MAVKHSVVPAGISVVYPCTKLQNDTKKTNTIASMLEDGDEDEWCIVMIDDIDDDSLRPSFFAGYFVIKPVMKDRDAQRPHVSKTWR